MIVLGMPILTSICLKPNINTALTNTANGKRGE
jgi:hypothetical protein